MSAYLEVNNLPVDGLHRFCLRWVESDKGPVAVLYHDGKRVTQPWLLMLTEEGKTDEHGGNANTA